MAQRLAHVIGYLRRLTGGSDAADSDRALLERFARTRDEAAFAELVSRHGSMVLNVCYRVLADEHAAEDAFQAVFLVLAHKAGSVAWRDSIASWLYETAQRTALKARTASLRHKQRERQVSAMSSSETAPDTDWHDLRQLLDVELARLPEKYRAPLVLCYLEGKTNEEAAVALGWTKGTVSGRLARARDLLKLRLERKGLTLASAALLAELVTQHAADAALTPTLAGVAVQAARRFAAGEALAGSTPQAVINLAEGVLRTMYLSKIKIAVAAALAFALVAGAGVVIKQTWLPGAAGVQAASVPVRETPEQPKDERMVRSKPVTKDEAEFVVETLGVWEVPIGPQPTEIPLTLRITNRSKQARTFVPWRGVPVMRSPDGNVLPATNHGRNGTRKPPTPASVEPGKTLTTGEPARLGSGKKGLYLQFYDITGSVWTIDGLAPGKYSLALKSETIVGLETASVQIEIRQVERERKPADARKTDIELNKIWALAMPGTKPMNVTMSGGTKDNPNFVAPEGKLVQDIRYLLGRRPRQGMNAGKGFVVPGTGMAALKLAHAVLVNKQARPESIGRSAQPASLVFYSYTLGSYAHITGVDVDKKVIRVHYRFVGHMTKEVTEHFALIPLPKLPAGEYQVEYDCELTPAWQNRKEVLGQLIPRIVCRPFTFTVLDR